MNYMSRPLIPEEAIKAPFRLRRLNNAKQASCNIFGITPSELTSKKRKRSLVMARSFVSYYMKGESDITLCELAKSLGGRDHSTILHNIRSMEAWLEYDKQTKILYEQFLKEIG
jgi:chromosomal replication initiator protein